FAFGGGTPTFMSSKFTVSAAARAVAMVVTIVTKSHAFMISYLICDLWQRRADLQQSTDQKPAFYGIRQILCPAASPVMEEHDARLLVRHVLMDGDNIDLVLEQRF